MAASIRAAVTGSLGLVTCSKWSHRECLTVNCSPPKNVSEYVKTVLKTAA